MSIKVHGLDDKILFGKHFGRPVRWVIDNDPSWLVWAIENTTRFDIDKEAEAELEAMI